jgi:hypothetical protein
MILATNKQIQYLQELADKAERIKTKHPSLIPPGLFYQRWELGITSDKASLCIQFYKEILAKADMELHPQTKVAEIEDLPA